jgi:Bifunctional DNA primase/polymerase, N-terminal
LTGLEARAVMTMQSVPGKRVDSLCATPAIPRELLESFGALYGELGLALTFTRTNDPSKGDTKQGTTGWRHAEPLPHAARGVALMTAFGQHRNPALVARASRLIIAETDTPGRLAQLEAFELPRTVTVQSSAPYKRHHWFRPWSETMPTYASIRLEAAAVTVDEDRLYLVPPAIHPTGTVYSFVHSPVDTAIAVLPKDAYEELVRQAGKDDAHLREQIETNPDFRVTEGRRREAIFRFACFLRRWETDAAAIEAECQRWNLAHCEPPVARIAVHRQVEGAMRKTGGHELVRFGDA